MTVPCNPLVENKATQLIGVAAAAMGEALTRNEATNNRTVTLSDLTREDLTGLTLGSYELGKRIGQGGMGQVFRATHRHLNREVAIKFVNTEHNGNRELDARFVEETRAVGQLQDSHIVQAYDAGSIDGIQYLVTELLDGSDLGCLVHERGPVAFPIAMEIARQAATALAKAHRGGFVHRDIKPSNLFCTNEGQIKLLDFGLVRRPSESSTLTAHGSFMGTMDFVAPEQAENPCTATPQSDIYSLGCTIVYLLTGHPPYPDSAYPTAVMKLRGHFADASNWETLVTEQVPKQVVLFVNKMMAKTPAERFESCETIVESASPFASHQELKAWLFHAPTAVEKKFASPLRRIKWLYIAVPVLVTLFIAITTSALLLRSAIKMDTNVSSENGPSNSEPANVSNDRVSQDQSISTAPVVVREKPHQPLNAKIPNFSIPIGRGVSRPSSQGSSKHKVE